MAEASKIEPTEGHILQSESCLDHSGGVKEIIQQTEANVKAPTELTVEEPIEDMPEASPEVIVNHHMDEVQTEVPSIVSNANQDS